MLEKSIMRLLLVVSFLALLGFASFRVKEYVDRSLSIAEMVKDIDGNSYNTVKIGDQVWFVENLKVARFRNGDTIPEAGTKESWAKANYMGQPAWCHVNNDSSTDSLYGKLYNWYAVSDPRGLAPDGCRIPSYDDWVRLRSLFESPFKAGASLKHTSYRSSTRTDPPPTNESGFSAVPGGQRFHDGSLWFSFGNEPKPVYPNYDECSIWSITTYRVSPNHAWSVSVHRVNNDFRIKESQKGCGFSVRCLIDNNK